MCPYRRRPATSDAEQRKIVRTQGVAGMTRHRFQHMSICAGTSSMLQMTRNILRWSMPERPNWTRFLLETSVRFRCFKKSRRRCGRGRHGRPWPCEWDVGREPDRDERSEPPAATPPPDELNRWGHVNAQLRRRLQKQCGTTPRLFL